MINIILDLELFRLYCYYFNLLKVTGVTWYMSKKSPNVAKFEMKQLTNLPHMTCQELESPDYIRKEPSSLVALL